VFQHSLRISDYPLGIFKLYFRTTRTPLKLGGEFTCSVRIGNQHAIPIPVANTVVSHA